MITVVFFIISTTRSRSFARAAPGLRGLMLSAFRQPRNATISEIKMSGVLSFSFEIKKTTLKLDEQRQHVEPAYEHRVIYV